MTITKTAPVIAPDTKPETSDGSGSGPCWPPLAHIMNMAYKGYQCKQGDIALCGAKLMGVNLGPVSSATGKRCAKCDEIHRRSL